MQMNLRVADYSTESRIRRKLHEFRICYSRLIDRLQAAFTGQQTMLLAAVGDTYEIDQWTAELMRIPYRLDDGATSVGPSFEFVPT